MKEIGFAFDAFGQWSEHYRSKMKWRMKVGIEWSKAWPIGQRLVASRPPSPSFLPFPSTISLLAQPPHLWDRMEGLWPHGLAA
jgi:hypothetical protein